MATSGLRIEEFNPRSQSRPQGRFWFVGKLLQPSAIGIQPARVSTREHSSARSGERRAVSKRPHDKDLTYG